MRNKPTSRPGDGGALVVASEGRPVGLLLGRSVGELVLLRVLVGRCDGWLDGESVGDGVGNVVGDFVGSLEGESVGCLDGRSVGGQIYGPPTQSPSEQMSDSVQGLPSLQGVPVVTLLFTHWHISKLHVLCWHGLLLTQSLSTVQLQGARYKAHWFCMRSLCCAVNVFMHESSV